MSLLEIRDLVVSYGGIEAVKGISLEVAAGELVCLIGANGAGKTTTLRALCGLHYVAAGSVRYGGTDITNLPSYRLVEYGIALVPEGRGIFSRLSVLENLQMGAYARRDKPAVAEDLQRVLTLFPRLEERRTQAAGTLSGGEQQMLAIGRALMSRPKLLLLDEPSMGLAPILVGKIFATIRSISEQGATILLIEQNAKLALETSDRAYVMESGRIRLSGAAASLLCDPQIRHSYLGE